MNAVRVMLRECAATARRPHLRLITSPVRVVDGSDRQHAFALPDQRIQADK